MNGMSFCRLSNGAACDLMLCIYILEEIDLMLHIIINKILCFLCLMLTSSQRAQQLCARVYHLWKVTVITH